MIASRVLLHASGAGDSFVLRATIRYDDDRIDDVVVEHPRADILRRQVQDTHASQRYRLWLDGIRVEAVADWSAAYRAAREDAYRAAIAAGAKVRRNQSLRHLVERRHLALADASRVVVRDDPTARRSARAQARRDFSAWCQALRSRAAESPLADAMRAAYNTLDSYDGRRAEDTLTAADEDDREVARQLVRWFAAGWDRETMADSARTHRDAERRVRGVDSTLYRTWSRAYDRLTGVETPGAASGEPQSALP